MGRSALFIFTFLSLLFTVSHSATTFQDYWNQMLPETPMPSAVRDHLGEEQASMHGVNGEPVTMDLGSKPFPLVYYSKKEGDFADNKKSSASSRVNGKSVTMDLENKPFPLVYYSKKKGDIVKKLDVGVVSNVKGKSVTMDLGNKPFPLVYYSKNHGDVSKSEKKLDDGVVSGVDGKSVTMDLGNKPLPLVYYSKKDGDVTNSEKSDVGVVSGVNGKSVTMDLGNKPFPLVYYSKKHGDVSNSEKKLDDGVVSSVNGKSVTMDLGNKPFPLVYYSKKDGDVTNSEKSVTGVVSGVDGKSVTMDLGNKPFPLVYYSKKHGDVSNSEKKSDDGVVSGVNKKSVTMDLGNKPFPLVYYSKKDGEVSDTEKSDDGVVSGVNREAVTMDLGNKPFPLVYYSKKDGDDNAEDLSNKPLPSSSNSRKLAAGSTSNREHDRIDRDSAASFFLYKDLHVGAKMKMLFRRRISGDNFLHRDVANTIPFSSDKLPQILSHFSVQPGSPVAGLMERTIRDCEHPPAPPETKRCATSLEDMVDYVTSSLGTNSLRTLTTVVGKDAPEQLYTIQSWSVVPTPNWTVSICHVGDYPYTIFQCHMVPQTKPYVVKLVGEDGTTVDAAAICHLFTDTWAPKYYVLRAFGVKPGETTVCHLALEGEVIWIPRTPSVATA